MNDKYANIENPDEIAHMSFLGLKNAIFMSNLIWIYNLLYEQSQWNIYEQSHLQNFSFSYRFAVCAFQTVIFRSFQMKLTSKIRYDSENDIFVG